MTLKQKIQLVPGVVKDQNKIEYHNLIMNIKIILELNICMLKRFYKHLWNNKYSTKPLSSQLRLQHLLSILAKAYNV